MCGILGIIATDGSRPRLRRRQILSMRDRMAARGPDDAGLLEQGNVVLAHRRLAIRDLEHGHQPWVAADGSCALVYNGEIYNDAELRRELQQLGHTFRTRCDTEVLLAAYLQWGDQCPQKLVGMFAFAVFDFRDNSLLLVRDRFGIKPCFFAVAGRDFLFASSIAALLKHPDVSNAPNMGVLSHYLTTLRLTLGRETVYQNVLQLLPAELLWLRQGGEVEIRRYWDYPQPSESPEDFATASQTTQDLLQQAIRCRLSSDVPVGMFLSGGVDSNTIASFMREAAAEPFPAVCGGAANPAAGDSLDGLHAQRCAEAFGLSLNCVELTATSYHQRWLELLDEYETPVSTPSDVTISEIARAIRPLAGVVLGGEGADELFCGYTVPHAIGLDYERLGQLSRGQWRPSDFDRTLFLKSLLSQYGRADFASEVDLYFAANSLLSSVQKASLLQPWVWDAAEHDEPMRTTYGQELEQAGHGSPARRQAVLLHRINLESLLSRLDSATMLSGLEARVPYTDHRLVEYGFRLPFEYHLNVASDETSPFLAAGTLDARGSLRSKRILREIARRRLPSLLANRPKQSFPTPVSRWLAGPWNSWAFQSLQNSPFAQDFFTPVALRGLVEAARVQPMAVWPILNLTSWGDRTYFHRQADPLEIGRQSSISAGQPLPAA